jgi:hypothetical protein
MQKTKKIHGKKRKNRTIKHAKIINPSGKRAESLLTTNSVRDPPLGVSTLEHLRCSEEGDRRSPKEFGGNSFSNRFLGKIRSPFQTSSPSLTPINIGNKGQVHDTVNHFENRGISPLESRPSSFGSAITMDSYGNNSQNLPVANQLSNNTDAIKHIPEALTTPTESDTIYIVRYRNNHGIISEKEVFKQNETESNTYTRYIFNNNTPLACSIPIYDIGHVLKKKYEPVCPEISLAPLGKGHRAI